MVNIFKTDFPREFEEFIGNDKAKTVLSTLRNNFVNNDRDIPNVFLYGRAGLGKTTLTRIFASETGNILFSCIGNQLTIESLHDILTKVGETDILFIDEVHGLDKNVQEVIYTILQEKAYYYSDKLGRWQIDLPRLSIFAATTDIADMPKTFLDRFQYRLILDPYSEKEMLQILELYLSEYKANLDDSCKRLLVKISQSTPRLLKNYINSMIDLGEDNYYLTKNDFTHMMNLLSISPEGFNKLQVDYIALLEKHNQPIGLNALSAMLGVSEKDLVYSIEPFLIEEGIILRTPKGRSLNKSIY